MRKLKKICFILPTLHAGGVENYCLRFAGYSARQFRICILSLHPGRGDLHTAFEKTGVRLIYQPVGYLNPLGLLRLFRFLKREKFDTLVDFTGNFSGIRLVLMRIAGVPRRIVFYRRSSNAFGGNLLKRVFNRFLNALVYRHATHIFSNSNAALEYFFPGKFKQADRFRVIPNGMDTGAFLTPRDRRNTRDILGIPQDAFVIGHVGRMDPAKNHATIFRVARRMAERSDAPYFICCGRGTDGADFKRRVEELGLSGKVHGIGLQTDIPAILQAMDAFYFPSLTEGQPNALIEALLAGLPVVASDIPPIREMWPPELRSALLPPMDEVGAVRALMAIREGTPPSMKLRDWAITRFDQHKNFKLFSDAL